MEGKKLATRYDPKNVEEKRYSLWEQQGLFHAEVNPGKVPFCVVIPPPNVTGSLTMGHVMDNTPQDIIVRWRRMQGFETLWVPGTDHAGIATQNVVERQLATEGQSRHDLGREQFLEHVWAWKKSYGGRITQQLKRLGCSCDWQRERFTMDEGLSAAVQEAFIRLFEKGLIYRGKYIINWCPRCQTALSDEEVEHKEMHGNLWYIRYPVVQGEEHIVVATTRPETMLGDTAVAVNPKDDRYRHLGSRRILLPIVNREIPVIQDDFVDPEFGTGIVKVTPAHDPNDFELGRNHNLESVVVMNENGTMNENAGARYAGMDRFECREVLVEDLQKQELLEKIETHIHSVGHCYRCHTMVEPYLSDQWFVKMKPLAEPALQAVRDGRIRFFPSRWASVYLDWMENIRDWCISRQIWWGHRIPVWYCQKCPEVLAARGVPQSCPRCGGSDLRQDEDVLDTWFSSWLWPFSTLGWPDDTPELKYFYPISFQNSGYDIIFFWVARMIMAGFEFMGHLPFPEIYIHGMVKDERGRWMSKSLGNSPDPLEIIEKFGADAVRFSMVLITAQGQDAFFSEEKVVIGRNFANKIWNASRLILMNSEDFKPDGPEPEELSLTLSDRWILSRLHRTVGNVTESLTQYRFNEAAQILYDFVWHQYCDWYLELIKPRLYGQDEQERRTVQYIALVVLDGFLRLLHPFMPFITEEIWQEVKDRVKHQGQSIVIAPWPQAEGRRLDAAVEREMETVQKVVVAIRNMRGDMNIPPGQQVRILISGDGQRDLETIEHCKEYVLHLAKVENLDIGRGVKRPKNACSAVVGELEVFLPLEGVINLEVERKRLELEIDRISGQLENAEKKLQDENFVHRAPQEVVDRERLKREDYETSLKKLHRNLEILTVSKN
ncbi:MAG: valine--tRNA ligase [Gemmatimonadota bacterium]|nr:MAG: valine--tRNA ligase [Gemmatimonadota bacterium]